MNRTVISAGALALALSMLTACGDDGGGGPLGGGGDYCDAMKDAAQDMSDMTEGRAGDFNESVEQIEEMRDSAPDEVKDDWDVFLDAVKGVAEAFEEAGITPEDLEAMQNGERPEGVDAAALVEAMGSMQAFGTEEFQEASEAISAHAQEECDVELPF